MWVYGKQWNINWQYEASDNNALKTSCGCVASPRPRSSPSSQSFVVNSTVVVQCLADSHPTPTFIWRRGGSVVTSSDRLKVDPATGTLIIYSAEETDAGQWECVASNEHGEGATVAQLNFIGETVPQLYSIEIVIMYNTRGNNLKLLKHFSYNDTANISLTTE